jgi:hypothetical protein
MWCEDDEDEDDEEEEEENMETPSTGTYILPETLSRIVFDNGFISDMWQVPNKCHVATRRGHSSISIASAWHARRRRKGNAESLMFHVESVASGELATYCCCRNNTANAANSSISNSGGGGVWVNPAAIRQNIHQWVSLMRDQSIQRPFHQWRVWLRQPAVWHASSPRTKGGPPLPVKTQTTRRLPVPSSSDIVAPTVSPPTGALVFIWHGVHSTRRSVTWASIMESEFNAYYSQRQLTLPPPPLTSLYIDVSIFYHTKRGTQSIWDVMPKTIEHIHMISRVRSPHCNRCALAFGCATDDDAAAASSNARKEEEEEECVGSHSYSSPIPTPTTTATAHGEQQMGLWYHTRIDLPLLTTLCVDEGSVTFSTLPPYHSQHYTRTTTTTTTNTTAPETTIECSGTNRFTPFLPEKFNVPRLQSLRMNYVDLYGDNSFSVLPASLKSLSIEHCRLVETPSTDGVVFGAPNIVINLEGVVVKDHVDQLNVGWFQAELRRKGRAVLTRMSTVPDRAVAM